jgi:molybdopterin converting factor small subunit
MSEHSAIRIKYLGAFVDVVQSREETCKFSGSPLSTVVDYMLERNSEKFRNLLLDPSTGELRSGVTLLVNGQRREPQYELSDGDEITLLTPIAGGAHA